jgi:putative alpha-1,2-mannosidase
MSAWYVWGSLGLFPVAGRGIFFVGAPVFAQTRMALAGGSTLQITAHNTGPAAVYVQWVTLNGVQLDTLAPAFRYADLLPGANTLEVWLDVTPPPGFRYAALL